MVSRVGREIELSPVEMGSRLGRKVEIDMASGSPDPNTIPLQQIRDAYNEVIESRGPSSLFYPGAGGQHELIDEIKRYLPSLKLNSKGSIVVTSGAQHAIELVAKYLLEDNVIAVENPTFVETLASLKHRSSIVLPVNIDANGISIEELDTMTKVIRPELVYVIPNCHNPGGVNLCEDRRKALAEMASERNFFIIEDDPYRPIAGDVPSPIKNHDRTGKVIYISSFSKILAPGLRVGFIVANDEIAERVSLLEQLDFSTSTINQYVISSLLRKGFITSRMTMLYNHYKRKMKTLIDSLTDAGLSSFNEPK
ncbi:MAG: PLP-dependent aminotransferase family protein, partial [Metallosphaera sp.]